MATHESKLRVTLLDQVSGRAKVIGNALGGLQRQASRFTSPMQSLTGRVVALGATYLGVTEGFSATYSAAADAQAALTEIGIKASLSQSQLAQMQQRLAEISPRVNQFTADLTAGVDTMLTMGLGAAEAMGAIEAIGRASTATGATIEDLSSASVSAMQNLGVSANQIQTMLEGMTEAGNAGAFEAKDMAKYFPQLTASAKSLGMAGVPAINDMAAALQIARRGAGDASTAANNLANFMGKLMTPETIKNFKKFGVDVTKELQKAHKKGVSPIEHFIELIDEKTQGGKADLVAQLFGDKQVLDFVRPMLSDFKDYLKIREGADRANGVIADAYARRMQDAHQKTKALSISLSNLGTSIGAHLLEPIGKAADYLSNVFNTLDQRVTLFDRIKYATDGLLNGLGLGGTGDIAAATKAWREFFFGVEDGSKAADDAGRIFKRFRDFGNDLRWLTDAIKASPLSRFMVELAGAIGVLAVSKWGRLFVIAYGISALINAMAGAETIGQFIEQLKSLSAIEWAGIGVGVLLLVGKVRKLVNAFRDLSRVTPKSLPGAPKGGAGAPATAAGGGMLGWLAKNGWKGLKWGTKNLLGPVGTAWGAYEVYDYINSKIPTQAPPPGVYAQQAMDNARGARQFGIGGSTTETLPGKTADDLGIGQQPVRLDQASVDAVRQPAGVQQVQVMNLPPRPNVNVQSHFTINGVNDPEKIANDVSQRLAVKLREEMDGIYADTGYGVA